MLGLSVSQVCMSYVRWRYDCLWSVDFDENAGQWWKWIQAAIPSTGHMLQTLLQDRLAEVFILLECRIRLSISFSEVIFSVLVPSLGIRKVSLWKSGWDTTTAPATASTVVTSKMSGHSPPGQVPARTGAPWFSDHPEQLPLSPIITTLSRCWVTTAQ